MLAKIETLKGKVIVDNNIKNLCDQVTRLSENLAKLEDNNLKDKVIDICKDAGIEIGYMDTEGCHRLSLSINNAGGTKDVIVKFVNRKHSEDMLWLKKIISSRSKVFISNSLSPYYRYLWGICYHKS